MTVIVYGIGAIGGSIAARLTLAGHKVAGIARGAQFDAIHRRGLTLRTPAGEDTVDFACFADPTEIGIGAGDTIILTVKSQDTANALARLRAAGVENQSILCAQNGVANERAALRYFANVYGVSVILPATYVRPGEVAAFGAPNAGILEIGRFPDGTDAVTAEMAALFTAAGIAAFENPHVMGAKYAKLLQSVGLIIEAAMGKAARQSSIAERARLEAEAVLAAAGIAADDGHGSRPDLMTLTAIPGVDRVGPSTVQSLTRGTGSIETDFLNGEIVLLGRLHGVPTPVNALLCTLAQRMLSERLPLGSIAQADVEGALSDAA
jgi:2-dehydropantoate 2-reductase